MTGGRGADLRHIETFLFDLDNTLYPVETEIMAQISLRMTAFVAREMNLPPDEARALQKQYWREHGTTLAGLMAHHGVDPQAFLDEVHDVSMDLLHPDPALGAAIASLPGRKIVFTNSDERHARRILDRLGFAEVFDGLYHIELSNYIPKPQPEPFADLLTRFEIDPKAAAFFEDSPANLEPGRALGMTTVLVGAHALEPAPDFVDYRAADLTTFLLHAQVRR